MVSLTAVVERTNADAPLPWPVLPEGAPWDVRLTGAASEEEVGSVVLQLAQYNKIVVAGRTAEEILADVVAAESLVLPGGIAARDDTGREISPGCCAGLEEWREWLAFESTGMSPWMGHEPDPHLEREGDTVRLWSHAELAQGDYGEPFAFEMRLPEFRQAIAGVQDGLRAFLAVLGAWAQRHAPGAAVALTARFDRAFEVSAARDAGA
jgi:hypothetical protein